MKLEGSLLTRIASNDPTLTSLDLSSQNLQLDDLETLVKAFKTNTHLKQMNIANNFIGDKGLRLLSTIGTLTSLNVSGNDISEQGTEVLAKHPSLTELDMSYNRLHNAGAAELLTIPHLEKLSVIGNNIDSKGAELLSTSKTLRLLNLSNNSIDTQGAAAFASNTCLTHLNLSDNYIEEAGAIALASSRNLISLDISYNELGFKIAKAFAANHTLQHLSLAYNHLGAEGAKILSYNDSLVSLNLAGNRINNEGIIAIGKNNKTLRQLNLSFNQINNDGIQGVTELANHPTLTHLDLSFNQITFSGMCPLAHNKNLKWLGLAYNLVSDIGASIIAQNPSVLYLDLSANQVGFDGAYAISQNNTLKVLKLSYNPIEDAGAIILAQNNTLEELVLQCSRIGDPGATTLSRNITLKTLNLDFNPITEKGKEALLKNKGGYDPLSVKENPFTERTIDYRNVSFLLSQDFICVCNNEGLIVFFNATFIRVFGYCAEELLGKMFIHLLYPDDREMGRKKLAESTKFPITSEIRCLRKEGSFRILRWSSQLKNGYFYIIGIDITEQKKMDAFLRKEEERQLTKRVKEGSEFISHLCHEIRNPLSGLFGLTEGLQKKTNQLKTLTENATIPHSALRKELPAWIDSVNQSLREMRICQDYQKSILDDNLDISKIAEKKLLIEKKPFGLRKAIQDVLNMLKEKAIQKNLKILVCLPPKEEVVRGDDIRLKQVAINLIGNAIKFTETGYVAISLDVKNRTKTHLTCEFEVMDSGTGIAEEDRQHLFERFTTLNPNLSYKHKDEGSGLGLYLTKQLVDLMNGKTTVESKKDKGTRFSCMFDFEIPSEKETQELEEKEKVDSSEEEPPSDFLRKKTVLVAEDNKINLRLLKRLLEEAQCQVLSAENGLAAVEFYKNNPDRPDIILMDVVMPQMDGLDATRQIRQYEEEKKLSQVPIIVVTGQALEEERQKAYQTGIDSYVTKPYKKKEIYLAMFEVLSKKSQKDLRTENESVKAVSSFSFFSSSSSSASTSSVSSNMDKSEEEEHLQTETPKNQ